MDINITPTVWEKLRKLTFYRFPPAIWDDSCGPHFSVSEFPLSVPQRNRNWPWILIIYLFWLGLSNESCHTTKIQKAKSPLADPWFSDLRFTLHHFPYSVWLPWASSLEVPWLQALTLELSGVYTSIQPEGPERGGTTHCSPSSQALDAHTDSKGVPVLFVFRISNFFIIFFRFGLDFFLHCFLPWGCVFNLTICLQPPFEYSGKYSLNFCCTVFLLSQ